MSMIRVSRRRPCPICGRPDWCLVAEDGSAAICQRIESDHRVGDAGHLHRLQNNFHLPPRRYEKPKPRPKRQIDWNAEAKKYQRQLNDAGCQYLANRLGISAATLRVMGVGWCPSRSCWTWPMRNADGRIVGIRTREVSGEKKTDAGSDGSGLFFVREKLSANDLLICEGPTDTAALVDAGFESVVGKPSCTLGDKYVVEIIRRLQPSVVLLIPDADQPGLEGFSNLANEILNTGAMPLERIDAVTPPPNVNDVREWAQKNRNHLAGRIAGKLEQIKQRTGGSSHDA